MGWRLGCLGEPGRGGGVNRGAQVGNGDVEEGGGGAMTTTPGESRGCTGCVAGGRPLQLAPRSRKQITQPGALLTNYKAPLPPNPLQAPSTPQ